MDYINQVPDNDKKPVTKSTGVLTPEKIVGKLFSMHNIAHFLHLQTTSYAQHKMLDDVYNGLVGSKDTIAEYLLGIQAPKRFGPIVLDPIPSYSEGVVSSFLQQGFDFTCMICEYAEEKELEELCNLASDLQGIFVRGKYLNTLK